MAARSDRFTRSSLAAISAGGASGRKWTPATSASVVITSSWSAGMPNTAASSVRPSAPGKPAARGFRYRSIRPNSPAPLPAPSPTGGRGTGGVRGGQIVRADGARQLVEHTVHHGRFAASVEGMGDIDIFADHDPRMGIDMDKKLESSCPQDRPYQQFKPL